VSWDICLNKGHEIYGSDKNKDNKKRGSTGFRVKIIIL